MQQQALQSTAKSWRRHAATALCTNLLNLTAIVIKAVGRHGNVATPYQREMQMMHTSEISADPAADYRQHDMKLNCASLENSVIEKINNEISKGLYLC